ncbi:MAG: thioredoxin [Verrucomicrobiae bacterium]|nr:thioredoxin [Verrucomicrobiae bacterium]
MARDLIVTLTGANFAAEVKQSKTPVLVDFWAEWCGPCRMLAPILDEIAAAMNGKLKIVKANVDDNQELAGEYGIRSIPTLLLFVNGEVKEQLVGAQSRQAIEAKLAPHLG